MFCTDDCFLCGLEIDGEPATVGDHAAHVCCAATGRTERHALRHPTLPSAARFGSWESWMDACDAAYAAQFQPLTPEAAGIAAALAEAAGEP